MTKLKGNAVRMLQMFRTHKYRLIGEERRVGAADKIQRNHRYEKTRPSVWKVTRQLFRMASSPNDKLGTGKGKGKPTYKSITPKASGLEHDDEWLIIDDDLSTVPQQWAQAVAARADTRLCGL